MPAAPPTHYARSGDVDLAYQVIGDGPFDFVFVPGWIWNLELAWELPEIARFFERFARFSRLILFDKRGIGLSDRVTETTTLEQRADDIRAVMDTVGSERAAIGGWFDGGAMAAHFAATHPERVRALVVGCTPVNATVTEEGVPGFDPATLDNIAHSIAEEWGTASMLQFVAPSVAGDPRILAFWQRFERASASPNAAAEQVRWNGLLDLRALLPVISAPTLVMQRADVTLVPTASVRELARLIPGARYVELPGADIYPFLGDTDAVVDEIEGFLTGEHGHPNADRVLATVLFTDIVGSTETADALGDRRWRDLLDAHNREIRGLVARYGGVEVDTTGDGFFATFDGPERAVRCACAAVDGVRALGIEIRAGLHTGEVVRSADGNLAGLAVHIGARVAARAGASEVIVTRTVKDLALGSTIQFDDLGMHVLKGVPDEWQLFRVVV